MMSVGLPLMLRKTGQTFSAQSNPKLERMWQMRVLCTSSTHQGVTYTSNKGFSATGFLYTIIIGGNSHMLGAE